MIHYISKLETPLLEGDVLSILGLSHTEYHTALQEGRLRRSIVIDSDPTGRLAFHNFWDLLEFTLSTQSAQIVKTGEADPCSVAECCDYLASDDYDVVPISGDAEMDYALARHSWIDSTIAPGWSVRLVDWCTSLLVQVGHHLHAVAMMTRTRVLGLSSQHENGALDQSSVPAFTLIQLEERFDEPIWEMRLAA